MRVLKQLRWLNLLWLILGLLSAFQLGYKSHTCTTTLKLGPSFSDHHFDCNAAPNGKQVHCLLVRNP